jgi:hypothetical protein
MTAVRNVAERRGIPAQLRLVVLVVLVGLAVGVGLWYANRVPTTPPVDTTEDETDGKLVAAEVAAAIEEHFPTGPSFATEDWTSATVAPVTDRPKVVHIHNSVPITVTTPVKATVEVKWGTAFDFIGTAVQLSWRLPDGTEIGLVVSKSDWSSMGLPSSTETFDVPVGGTVVVAKELSIWYTDANSGNGIDMFFGEAAPL